MTIAASALDPAQVLEACSRPGAKGDAVAGLVPQLVAAPTNAEEVAAILRQAARRSWAVVVRGGGTKLSWGGPPQSCDLVLDTGRLDRLVEHEPGDLICVAGAGMRLSRLQALVAAAPGFHQRLMLDPPGAAKATLGGLVATRAAGPLRTRYGTMRDLLIGAQFVLADGTIARTGGKVVKNVAGYDLDKLLVGSLGTLAVLVEVALRLHPVPEASRTVLLEDVSAEEAARFCAALRRTPTVPSVVEVAWPERFVLVRVDSSPAGAERQAERLVELEPKARVLTEDEAKAWQARLADRPWQGAGVVIGLAIPLGATQALLEGVGGVATELSLKGTLGVGEALLEADPEQVAPFCREVEALGGHTDLRRAPTGLAVRGSDPPDPVARDLMRAVKAACDPAGTLAPRRWSWAA